MPLLRLLLVDALILETMQHACKRKIRRHRLRVRSDNDVIEFIDVRNRRRRNESFELIFQVFRRTETGKDFAIARGNIEGG